MAAEAVSEAPVVQESSLEELPFLVLFDGWASLFRDRVVPWRIALSDRLRSQLERELLPAFVAKRRWYAAKGEAVRQAEIADQVEWKPGDRSWLVAAVRVASADGDEQPYFLPLTIAFEDADERLLRSLSPVAISRVRQHSSVGILADAFSDEGFVRAVLQAVRDGITVKTARGTLRFNPTDAFTRLAGTDFANLPVSLAGAASSNTIIAVGDRLFVKGYRRLQAGTNPELEIGRYLTDVVHFEHSVPIAGSVDYLAEDGRTATLMLVQGYVTNQGDAWDYTLNYLGHYFEELARGAATATGVDVHNGYVTLMNTLGTRTAELHAAFARSTGDPMFDPVALTEADVASWVQSVRKEATVTIDLLAKQRDALAEPLRADADRLLAQRERLLARIGAHAKDRSTGAKTRLHGDYHLGQVLVTQNDFAIIDFEGEPSRKIAERAQKHSALKDVAGMLRSFDYALHAAASAFLAGRPDARDAVAQGGRQWRQLATAAFLDGYDGTAARSQGLASARAEERRLLELFMLEKGVYELRYELGNRPEWVAIPIAGLVEMLEQGN